VPPAWVTELRRMGVHAAPKRFRAAYCQPQMNLM
jgi:hypothetical protein